MYEYNTKKEPLILKEYGRNIQKLIKIISEEKDKKERTQKSHILIRIMKSVNPKVRGISDDSRKLWDDLFIMSDYKLDIDAPYPMPQKDVLKKKVSRMPYKQDEMKFKHYGRNIELLLKKIAKEKDKEVQDRLLLTATRIMKGFNVTWNSDNNDINSIIEDIKSIIGKKVDFDVEKLKNEMISKFNNRTNSKYRNPKVVSNKNESTEKWTNF